MFDRYTDDARKVIFLARYEASRLGAPTLETGHLWLGLLRQSKKLIKRLAPQKTLTAVESSLILHELPARRVSMTVGLPLAESTARVLASAQQIADAQGQHHITPERLILALLQEEDAAD